jgi:hypothetical protein
MKHEFPELACSYDYLLRPFVMTLLRGNNKPQMFDLHIAETVKSSRLAKHSCDSD